MAVTVNQSWSTEQKKNLQSLLNQYGFTDNNGNALTVDGMVGPKTQQALAKMNTYQQHLTKPDASTSAWQTQLNDWGYKDANGMSLKEDGIYGPKTDAATTSFENNFFDGFTGGTNQKNTVQTITFPTMPKVSDDQITSAVAPGDSAANMGESVIQQEQEPTATQKFMQMLRAQNSGSGTQTETILPFKATSAGLLDRTSLVNKLTDKAVAASNGTKPGESYTDDIKNSQGQLSGAAYKIPGSGGSTAVINKAFNDYNRNAWLDKSGFKEVAYKTDDPFYEFAEDVSDAYKNIAKTVTAPVTKVIGDYLKDPKNADNVKAIQEELSKNFQGVLEAFGMHYDEKTGQWYSDDKGVQQAGGYADFYDLLMPLLGFDVETTKVKFNYNGLDYTFRPWFGCYGAYSLFPGGEHGIYVDDGESIIPGADSAVQGEKKVYTDIRLYDRSGNLIMTTNDHGERRYWQFGSNAMAGVQDKSNMYMVATLSSDDKRFLETIANEANKQGKIRFEDVKPVTDLDCKIHYFVTYTYDPNCILSGWAIADRGFGGGEGGGW